MLMLTRPVQAAQYDVVIENARLDPRPGSGRGGGRGDPGPRSMTKSARDGAGKPLPMEVRR